MLHARAGKAASIEYIEVLEGCRKIAHYRERESLESLQRYSCLEVSRDSTRGLLSVA